MLINFIPRKDFPSGLWVAAFLLCCHMAEKGHLSHVSFYEGTNPIHGASPLWPNYASKASPPNVITLGFGCNIWIWGEGHTNIQFIASVRTRIHNEVVQFTVFFFFFFTILYSIWAEKAMAIHSRTLAWKIPWAEEPDRLKSMGLQRVRHNWATWISLFTFMHWRRKWQPTPVFLPGEFQGSLVGCRLWGRTESDTTEAT